MFNAQELPTIADTLTGNWAKVLSTEFKLPYIKSLQELLDNELTSKITVFPQKNKIFRALQLVDFDQTKVVILGQDPYHGEGQANGLAFAVSEGVKPPPSLQNIFKELSSDLGVTRPQNPSLEGWAKQGILLLNTVLTVRANQAFSHRNLGWEQFTEKIITELNNSSRPIVFLLWGAPAQSKAKLITNSNHLILKAAHPSPLSAYRGFLGCKHFSQTNKFLIEKGETPINWANT